MKKIPEVAKYVLVTTTLAIMVTVIVTLSFGSFFLKSREYAIQDGESTAAMSATRVEECITTGIDALDLTKQAITTMLDRKMDYVSGKLRSYLSSQAQALVSSTDGMFTGIYLYTQGNIIDGMGRETPENFVATERVWNIVAHDNPGTVVMTGPYVDALSKENECITFSVLLDDGDSVLATDMYVEPIQKLIESVSINGMGYGALLNRNGRIIAHPDKSLIGVSAYSVGSSELNGVIDEILSNHEKSFYMTSEIDGTDYYIFVRRISEKWLFVLSVTKDELFAPLYKTLYRYIIVSAIVYIVVLSYGIYGVRTKEREMIARLSAEQMSEKLTVALEEANAANIAKSKFLFNMSHDIRTPMNAISGFVDLAYGHADEPDVVRNYLSKAKTSEEYLLGMISDVLDMSRIESGNVTVNEVPVNLKKKTDNLIQIVRQAAVKKNIDVQFDIRGVTEPNVYLDITHSGRVAVNVLGNAVKYTPEGGSVFFSITQSPCEREGYITSHFEARDNGIGMSNEFLEHIYETFSREKNTTLSKVEGTGLGMSIVKSLIDLMGGTINVESVPGEGTTVSVDMDLRIAPPVEEEEEKPSGDISSIEGMRVLLVEDNELNREIARAVLSERGVLVDEAEDGSEAVSIMMAAATGYYDLVLMDVQMPVMDGYEATKAIRKLDNPAAAAVPIVAMTANAFEEDRRKAMDVGMNDHLAKPINIGELENVLRKYTKQKNKFAIR